MDYFWFGIFVAVNALFLWVLTANVSRLRLKYGVSLGDGDNAHLFSAIRAHANGLEQVPIFALGLLVLTLLHSANILLAGLVVTFSFARFCHAYGMVGRVFMARRVGAALTYVLQLALIFNIFYQLTVQF
jgi:hypothetical protein